MSKSTRKRRTRKPHAEFPLTRHPRGYWCKKVKGKLHYSGKIEAEPGGMAALDEWLRSRTIFWQDGPLGPNAMV